MNRPSETSGGKPLTHNTRKDFPHMAYFGAPQLSQLPATLGREVFNLIDQEATSFCTACNTSTARAYAKKIPMSFEFQAAKIGQHSGEQILNGADPKKALETGVLFGSLPQDKAPLNLANTGQDVADWTKWDIPLDLIADQNEASSYFRVDTGSFDAFDNIRSALWTDKQNRIARGNTGDGVVMAFSQWFAEWTGSVHNPDGTFTLTPVPYIVTWVPPIPFQGIIQSVFNFFRSIFPSLFGGEMWHAWTIIDWKVVDGVTYLVSQNSYGEEYGNKGTQLFTREVINATFADSRAGCYLYSPEDPKDVKSWQAHQSFLATIFNQ